MRRGIAVSILVLSAVAAIWYLTNQRIWSAWGLEDACKERTQAYFVSHGEAPTDWNPKMTSTLGDIYYLYADWHVGAKRYEVLCSASFGKSADKIGYEIGKPN